jgi:hypothetical protein
VPPRTFGPKVFEVDELGLDLRSSCKLSVAGCQLPDLNARAPASPRLFSDCYISSLAFLGKLFGRGMLLDWFGLGVK